MTNILQKNWLIARLLEKRIKSSVKLARGRMLDVGCGSQPYKKFFEGHVDVYLGTDLPSSPLVDNNIDVFSDTLAIPFKNASIDVILCTEVLQQVREPQKAMQEFSRLLKQNGILILTTTQMWHITNAPYDSYRFTQYGLEYLVESAEMKVKGMELLGGFWLRMGLKFCYFLHRFNRVKVPKVFIAVLLILPQLFFLLMDSIFFDPKDVINHFLIAEKRNS